MSTVDPRLTHFVLKVVEGHGIDGAPSHAVRKHCIVVLFCDDLFSAELLDCREVLCRLIDDVTCCGFDLVDSPMACIWYYCNNEVVCFFRFID